MANRKSKNIKQDKSSEIQAKRRMRMLQIFIAVFSILLILSLLLSSMSSF
jgi:hypothetical protein